MTTTIFRQTDNFQAYIEEVQGTIFFHIHIYKWAISTYKHIIKAFKDACSSYKDKGVEMVFTTVKTPIMLKMCLHLADPFDVVEKQINNETVWIIGWDLEEV